MNSLRQQFGMTNILWHVLFQESIASDELEEEISNGSIVATPQGWKRSNDEASSHSVNVSRPSYVEIDFSMSVIIFITRAMRQTRTSRIHMLENLLHREEALTMDPHRLISM